MRKFIAAASLTTLMVAGGSALAAAQPPANIDDQEPSCSLTPYPLPDNEYVFQNKAGWSIPLTIWNTANTDIIYQAWLPAGGTTPILTLGWAAGIGWSNNIDANGNWVENPGAVYRLGAYDTVDWCGSPPPGPGTTTTTGPPVTEPTVPPTSPPTTERELNCEELGAKNILATDPLYRYDLDLDGDGVACEDAPPVGTTPSEITTPSEEVEVAGVVVTQPSAEIATNVKRLAETGPSAKPWVVLGAFVSIFTGLGLVRRSRTNRLTV